MASRPNNNNSTSDRGTGEPRDGRDRNTQSQANQSQNTNNSNNGNDGRGGPNPAVREDDQRLAQNRNDSNQNNSNNANRSNQQNQQNNQSPGTDENGYPLNQDGTRDERHYDHGQGDVVNPETDGRLKENRGTANNQQNQQNQQNTRS